MIKKEHLTTQGRKEILNLISKMNHKKQRF